MHLFNFIAHFDINNENTNKYRGLDDIFEHDWASGFYWVRKKMNIFNMFVLDCNSCKPMDLLLILHSENKSWKIYFIVDGFEYSNSNFEYNYNIYWLQTWKNGQFLNIYMDFIAHIKAPSDIWFGNIKTVAIEAIWGIGKISMLLVDLKIKRKNTVK